MSKSECAEHYLKCWGSALVAICGLSCTAVNANTHSQEVRADICVYGGTSGGVVAAVQAGRMGRTVVLLEPGKHLGGMTAGGLSWTDVGSSDRMWVLGGIAREFYVRVGRHYGVPPERAFEMPSSKDATRSGYDFAKPPSLSFEPKVAEAVFTELASEAKVPVYFGSRLKHVRKNGRLIKEIETENGLRVAARLFIDATYEGDLMALAGVSYTCGREANAQYGESCNGVQGPATNPRAGKFEVRVDPYAKAGIAESGLLPYLMQVGEIGQIGSADKLIQSYDYRVCLTDSPSNRIPIAPPANYDPANYELLGRWIKARVASGKKLTLGDFLKYDPLQNSKWDFNNRWAISTDFVGGAHRYPEASDVERGEIALAHENYLRGFFHFLATNEQVPEEVRKEMNRFGLCRDEFVDNGGWPHQLYIREARRMVSDFIMTEQHCTGEKIANQSIGMGAYGIDMHAVRRIAHDAQAINEGTRSPRVPAPYLIGYGAIVPKAKECENLLVTFALSASHVAFGSIRMEPTFMILSQSAAVAANLAIEHGTAVQEVNYSKLALRLKEHGLVLGFHD